jgi:hypothetical protein
MNKELTLKNLGDVEHHVKALTKNYYDDCVPVKDLKFDNLNTVRIDGEKHTLRPMAQQGIAFRLGIPLSYLRKCYAELQAYNMNYWIKHEKNEELFFRFDAEDNVRTVFSPRYVPLDNKQIIKQLYALGYDKKSEARCTIDDDFMSLSIFDDKSSFKINGDQMRGGHIFSNSETGLSSFSLAAFLYRLVCANGLISRKNFSLAKFPHVSEKTLSKIPKLLEDTSKELSVQKKHFELSTKSHVDDPLATIDTFNKQFQLGPVERDAVEWAWPQEEGSTMFSVINTYTKAAQFESLSAASSFKLQKTGGEILSLVN